MRTFFNLPIPLFKQLIIIGCFGMVLNLHAQRYPFTTINVKDGLPQSSVFKIVQDKQGYIWMATEAGLCRYDGYKFITYSIHNGLGSKYISDIRFDPHGRLWISTMGKGISWFDGKGFHRFEKSNGLPSNQIRSLEFTPGGDLFLSTLDTGVVRLSKNKKPYVYLLPNGNDFAAPWKMICTKNGDIISVGAEGAYRFVADKNYEYELIYDPPTTLINSYEADNGDLWIGGVDQLVQIKQGHLYDRTDLLITLDGQPADVWDIFQPRNQPDIYISTTKGLIILEDSTTKWLTVANGVPYEHILDTYQDSYGNFWVGSYGGGAAILDSKGLDHFDYSDGVFPLSTAAIVDDGKGTMWLSTDNYGVFSFNGKIVQHHSDPRLQSDLLALAMGLNPVTKDIWIGSLHGQIVQLRDGNINYFRKQKLGESWPILHLSFLNDGTGIFCTQIGVCKLGLNDKDPVWIKELPRTYFRSSFIDHQKYLWLLGDEGQLLRWKNDIATDFTKIINPEMSGLDQGLYDPFHNLYWFCSSSGLIVWNGKSKHLLHSGNGLKSDSPWSITQDSIGRIWIGHEKGVECIDVDKSKISFIGYDQGFTPVETNSCVAMTDTKGDVWFGTISSASRIRINELKTDDRTGVLRIQKVWQGKKMAYEELYSDTACPPLTFNYNENTINIEMAALCYSNARDVRYSWFLDGYDEEWIINNQHREALYTNLPHGTYTFHAKAVEPNGYQTNEIIIKIKVLRPFWHRPWFYIGEFSFLGLLILLSFRFSSNPHQNKLGGFVTLLTILIVFESLLLYLSTYINKFTGDIPVFQLVMNVILAATLNPLEHAIQKIMRKWAMKRLRKQNNEKPLPPAE